MKKIICMVLLVWLPAFMMASQAMSMQMALENTHQMPATELHHGCHQSKNYTGMTHSKVHQCVVCTMCVLSHAVALNGSADSALQAMNHAQPLFDKAGFYSLNNPPALKPPKLS
jgi:hypothetical protein